MRLSLTPSNIYCSIDAGLNRSDRGKERTGHELNKESPDKSTNARKERKKGKEVRRMKTNGESQEVLN